MDLFDFAIKDTKSAPLAERVRPVVLDDFVGQEHLIGKGTYLRRAIQADRVGSCIFYGQPGCGKTTLANIIATQTNANFVKLNAVNSGVADAKKVIEEAKLQLKMYGKRTYLLLDECHRWSKAQSDSVLSAIEDGTIIFIGSTTENPLISMTRAIVSRCTIFQFKPLNLDNIISFMTRAIKDKKGLGNYDIEVDSDAMKHIAFASNGDLRTALNALELATITTDPNSSGQIHIKIADAEQSLMRKIISIDEGLYYDMLSAFCKSLRGSDADAAVYWAERMIQSGVDPLIIARRLLVHSAEDVGMADPMAQLMATSALQAMQMLGLPEGRIPLTNAIIYVAEASKSNSVVNALAEAGKAIYNCISDDVPPHLRDLHFSIEQTDSSYIYPHSCGGWVEQQYLPDELKDAKFYVPGKNGYEGKIVRAKIIKNNKG